MELFVSLLIAGAIMGIIDFFWLGFIAKKLYRDELGKLLLEKPNMVAGVLFYIIYVIGIVVFVVSPALQDMSWQLAAGLGALFGLVCYATYDLTNLATLKGFSKKIVVIDLAWGAVLTAVVASGTYFIVRSVL